MGGVAGVFLSGGVLSVASLIGFIIVFGIATRNGIMLVSHSRHLQEHEGVTELSDAVFRGAMARLAPILMTALAAGTRPDSSGSQRGQARQRDANADGHRHLRGPADVDGAQHAGRAGSLSPVR
jgi:hypothetical protein